MKKGIIITSIIALIAIITIAFAVSFQRGSQPERDKGDSAEQTVNEHSDEAEDELPSQSSLEFPSGSSIYIMDQDAVETDKETGITFVNNILLLFFEEGTTDEEVQRVVESVNGTVVGSLPFVDQYQVKIEPHSLAELTQICEELKENESVFEASYDLAVKRSTNEFHLPNDPWSPDETVEWTEGNEEGTTSPDGSNWGLEAIEAPSAWEMNDHFGTIKIGIVDDGFDVNHKDLKKNIMWVSSNNRSADHGTHVAGIIGAEADNRTGITGIVWNCELYLFDWKITEGQSKQGKKEGTKWVSENAIYGGVCQLIEEAFQDTASGESFKMIVNDSSGLSWNNIAEINMEAINQSGYLASMYLHSLLVRDYDFLIIQSAGNGEDKGDRRSFDAAYSGEFASINEDNCVTSLKVSYEDIVGRVVVVGAAREEGDNNYIQWEHSNAGDRVDICAPGEAIYSTVSGNKYKYETGTSMAAPMVTGVAALVWSANDQLTGADVKRIICDPNNTKYTVHDNPSPVHLLNNTYRLINAPMAIKAAIGGANMDHPENAAASDNWYYVMENIIAKILKYSKDISVSEDTGIISGGVLTNSMQFYDGKLYVSGGDGLYVYDEANGSREEISLDNCSLRLYEWQIYKDKLYYIYPDQNGKYFLKCADLGGKPIGESIALHNNPNYASYSPEFFIQDSNLYYTEFLPAKEQEDIKPGMNNHFVLDKEHMSYRIWRVPIEGGEQETIYSGAEGVSLGLRDINSEYLAVILNYYSGNCELILIPLKSDEPVTVVANYNSYISNNIVDAHFYKNTVIYTDIGEGLHQYDIVTGETKFLTDQIFRAFAILDDYCVMEVFDSTFEKYAVWYSLTGDQ